MVKRFFLFLIISFSFLKAQQINVNAFSDTSDYQIGDYIYFTVSVEYDQNIFLMNPVFQDSLKNIDIIKTENPTAKEINSKKITEYKFILSHYDSTEVSIPPLPVYYRSASSDSKISPVITPELIRSDSSLKVVFSNPVKFTVHSIKVSQEEDIKDVKEPLTIPLDLKIVLMWVVGGLILLAIIIFIIRKYFVKKKSEVKQQKEIILLPHIRALNHLKELESKELCKKGMIKVYHSEITEIIRQYFEERFNLPALELTTSESIDLLSNFSEAVNILIITHEFLTNADLVKFAKFIPVDSINIEMMNQARSIVQKTIPTQNEAMKESA